MSKPRTYKTEAVIIKKTKLEEAGRILTRRPYKEGVTESQVQALLEQQR